MGGKRVEDSVDDRREDQRPGGIVDQHQRERPRNGVQPRADGGIARIPASDDAQGQGGFDPAGRVKRFIVCVSDDHDLADTGMAVEGRDRVGRAPACHATSCIAWASRPLHARRDRQPR
jgi:hypothetical protein